MGADHFRPITRLASLRPFQLVSILILLLMPAGCELDQMASLARMPIDGWADLSELEIGWVSFPRAQVFAQTEDGALIDSLWYSLADRERKELSTSAPSASPWADNPDYIWTPPSDKTLVWSDEFDGEEINTSDWAYNSGPNRNELQYYTDNGPGGQNAYVSDGALVIKAMEQSMGGKDYTSARMKTEGKGEWKCGTVVAKIRMPYGKGIWPAFWMLGSDISSVGYPKCGEIDIVEMVGGGDGDRTVYATTHWGESSLDHRSLHIKKELSDPLWQDWHYYQLDWDPSSISIKVDGEEYLRQDISRLSYFQKPYFIILNIAVGGDWPGSPDQTSVFPQYMYVDWVRVYQ